MHHRKQGHRSGCGCDLDLARQSELCFIVVHVVMEFSSSFIVCFMQVNNFRDYSSTADAADAVSPVVESVSVVVVGIEVVVAAK